MYELLIQHDSTAYMPPVKEEVKGYDGAADQPRSARIQLCGHWNQYWKW